ncbi:MAG: hypothetical protein D6798_19710 [Deltaproteobacteria bacterium]|nr:MAG: hypothetical protein D6798_19710 [Deltaproteobacteria bacterium]
MRRGCACGEGKGEGAWRRPLPLRDTLPPGAAPTLVAEVPMADVNPLLLGLLLATACGPPVDRAGHPAIGARSAPPMAPPTATPTGDFREVKLQAGERATDAEFGYALAGAGDLDGDGHGELIIGAHQMTVGSVQTGAAYIFAGEGSGAVEAVRLLPSDGAAGDRFGEAVGGGGDLNGDGWLDVVVGARASDAGAADGGAVSVFYGSDASLDPGVLAATETVLLAPSPAEGARFGVSLAVGGDADGDGVGDLVVGADQHEGHGAAYVFLGDDAGVGAGSSTTLVPASLAAGDGFGGSVAWAGDVDGDGYDDVIVGAQGAAGEGGSADTGTDSIPGAGAAWLYRGSATGVRPSSGLRLGAASPGANDHFGVSVAGAGDLDGDGHDDVVVGAYQDDDVASDAGAIHVFAGGPDGPAATPDAVYTAPEASDHAFFGVGVAGAGDIDGDGYDDIIVGASGAEVDGVAGGAAYVFYGGPALLDRDRTVRLVGSDTEGADRFGKAVAGAGDVDGDGFFDVIAGACSSGSAPDQAGAAYLMLAPCIDGDGDGFCTAEDCDDADPQAFPGAAAEDDSACMRDADGDGYGDSAVEGDVTPGTDCVDSNADIYPGSAELDSTTACMSDADGDGYGDIQVPAGATPGTDCDDQSDITYPGAAWRDSTTACMTDLDGDGYGAANPPPLVEPGTDCADDDALTFLGAAEIEDPAACMTDHDDDGWGSSLPAAGVTAGTDCDDLDDAIAPDRAEVCNGLDDDCDGAIDQGAVDGTTWYPDADGDGWTAAEGGQDACEAPEGLVAASFQADCDDADPTVHPGAVEVADDGIDQDCDGQDAVHGGKGCNAGGAPVGPWALLGPLVLVVSRRRGRSREVRDPSHLRRGSPARPSRTRQ